MTPAMDRETKNCPCCNGRGYLRCDCWPGDCICGWGDEDCENCNGDGIVWADEYEWPAGLADAEGGKPTPTPDLITAAEAVTRLWDLLLFSSGTAAARQKRADVLHDAVTRLQAAVVQAKGVGE